MICTIMTFCFLYLYRYQSQGYPDFVDYLKFCDDVESIFTFKELEKAPLQEVTQFKPPEEWELNKLEPAAEQQFAVCMDGIAEKVRAMSNQNTQKL